ncbi:MAG: hypothetical protein KA248_03140 [Kiritimatiellae bacterium]|nr:hypothetical protein [Kiritimatiellia bacterium]
MNDSLVMLLFAALALAMTAAAVAFVTRWHHRLRSQVARVLAGNLVMGLWIAAVGLLVGEYIYRYIVDTTDAFGFSRVHRAWLARHWIVNPQGMRDNYWPYTLRPPAGKQRTVFMGDSFTAGHGIRNVEDRFCNLYRRRHPEQEVHMLAENGWESGHQLECLRDMARQGYVYHTLCLMYVLNDISDINPAWTRLVAVIEGAEPTGLLQHSFFLNWLLFRIKTITDPHFRHYGHEVLEAYDGPVWEEQKERLRALRRVVESGGGRLAVVLLPYFSYPAERYPYRAIHEQIGAFWRAEGVAFLDLLPLLEGRSPRELTVNPFDAHPNEKTHRLIAEQVDALLSAPRN